MTLNPPSKSVARGFTLVELLVVIAIIAVLAVLSFTGARRLIEKGRAVQTLAQFRDFSVGITMFITDYNVPPIPPSRRPLGNDTVYGDPKPNKYDNGILVGVLKGDLLAADYVNSAETLKVADINTRGETYVVLPAATASKAGAGKGKAGVGTDRNWYDSWGNQIMIAINAGKGTSSSAVLVDSAPNGVSDKKMDTLGIGEYRDTKPREQAFVLWSYGYDGKKGKNGASPTNITIAYAGSDDVLSW